METITSWIFKAVTQGATAMDWFFEHFEMWYAIVMLMSAVVWGLSRAIKSASAALDGLGKAHENWGNTIANSTETLDQRLASMDSSWTEDIGKLGSQMERLNAKVEVVKENLHDIHVCGERRLARLEGINNIRRE